MPEKLDSQEYVEIEKTRVPMQIGVQLKTEHFDKINMAAFLRILKLNFNSANRALVEDGLQPVDSVLLHLSAAGPGKLGTYRIV